jgi:transcriptional regulatory protein RtcR
LGVTLDASKPGPQRWERWRPTVDLARHEDLLVARLDLLHQPEHERLAKLVAADVRQVSPETEVVLHPLKIEDPWAFEKRTARSMTSRALPLRPRSRRVPDPHHDRHARGPDLPLPFGGVAALAGAPAQTSPQQPPWGPGLAIIDLDLARYDKIAARFARAHTDAVSFLKGGIATRNPGFNRLIEELEQVAIAARDPILLLGPTGAGKTRWRVASMS